ncbi:MAG: CRISPR-associated endonuclease Cas2 [Candidatus Brocadia sp.]|jgi:CRISPR-associated protein Cas2|nr:CRISPR-associated endoribonuclease Cas2 [Candidatus Brocadia fulgida]MCC6324057.1 CRISPR-associated endonuclease Cas2 [Candidatus Brocadia sp.]MCE7911469.1 CRISPR-associated endonuclease Cas2 [Candidatus Brocadia sp. AMX3]MDG5996429.1 CRISPR-associated endonuclease Cas2 [Candidatus Brocadia sp.]RIJ90290.1 MAG: CRISPR-associated endonuclease Cas2 [Candidatus Brocadia sp.]
MKGISDYAVVYDITSDAERERVDKVLKGFGFRVQKSVFECRLNKRGRDELIGRLEGLHIKTGFIKVYRLEYSSRDTVIGQMKKANIDDGHAFIV